jgi:nicotinic acid mononucleotide adenylyltransferase/nicotinamide mononucleotide (NMN) deamidase PncC
MTPDELVRDIHASGVRLVIAVTGGGSGAISSLLAVPGASRSILAAVVPYAETALVEWLGGKPDEFCAARTARAMAMAAFQKARQYDPAGKPCGIACTASLASDRPKRGAHRAHLAFQTASTTATASVELEKGLRGRGEEESLVTALLLNLTADAVEVSGRLEVPLTPGEKLATTRVVASREQQQLLEGRVQSVAVGSARESPRPAAVFPGAFNPLHQGHTKMAEIARAILGHEVAYELSVTNVDKPPLDFIEIHERLRQFAAGQAVWLTRAPRFVEKAELFPQATFVVGVDTLTRIGQSRYYQDSEEAMQRAIREIASRGCRFLVFGRQMEGRFFGLGQLSIPQPLAQICQEVPEATFRDDISSTELRRRQRSS